MAITASQVNALRERTGVSMMACKRALEEANGDEEKAIELLRKRGEAKAAEKSSRETKQGVVLVESSKDKAAIVKLLCETDFVAKNDEFIAIAKAAGQEALKHGAAKAVASQEEALKALIGKLGENMKLEVDVVEGQGLGSYIHSNGKVGVVVSLKSPDDEKARDVAMHIAAMAPKVVDPSHITEADVVKEREIWREQLKNEGKPENMINKIMEGKEKKFREEHALLKQAFVKDGNVRVEEYLTGNTVIEFKRFSI